jgi:glycosyltransferase involved in cell wall biosynthesis
VNALFVARTADATCYHRIMLPALALGADWCGLDAPPPQAIVGRGGVRGDGSQPDFGSYAALVLQTPSDEGWFELIPRLQAGGTKVFYEVDYDIHAFENPPEALTLIESMVERCDGVICATERIAERYAAFNANTHLCESGIDLRAYALTRPPHDTVNVGWAGRTLTHDEMRVWLAQVAGVLRARPQTNFISVGEPYGDVMADSGAVAPERCLSIPIVLPEQLPAAMSLFDIGFDPMGRQPWRRARSALRWLEAAAWGIPFVGDRRIYPRIEPGVTGFHARTPDELAATLVRLIDDEELRRGVGARAREAVASRYSMEALAPRWQEALA